MKNNQINFKYINIVALRNLQSLLNIWLPDGKRQGHEWIARNPTRADHKAGSFSINLNTGQWGDFATNDRGGDVVSLYAYLVGISQGDAAKDIAEMLNISIDGVK